MKVKGAVVILVLLLVLGATAGRAELYYYTVTDLGSPGCTSAATCISENGNIGGEACLGAVRWVAGQIEYFPIFTDSAVYGINDSGVAAGYRMRGGIGTNAILWNAGGWQDMPGLGGESKAMAINATGQVAGYARALDGNIHACLWPDENIVDLGTFGGFMSLARGMNDAGQVVGTFYVQGPGVFSYERAFLREASGAVQDLGSDGVNSNACDVNNLGQVAGWTNSRACLWNEGGLVDLGVLPGLYSAQSIALAINDGGAVVGWSGSMPHQRAFIWTAEDGLVDLNYLVPGSDLRLQIAADINNSGQIVGLGLTPTGEQHAFLLTPSGPADFKTATIPTINVCLATSLPRLFALPIPMPAGYDPAQVDQASVRLSSADCVDCRDAAALAGAADGADYKAKFNRSFLKQFSAGDVFVDVRGQLLDGLAFAGGGIIHSWKPVALGFVRSRNDKGEINGPLTAGLGAAIMADCWVDQLTRNCKLSMVVAAFGQRWATPKVTATPQGHDLRRAFIVPEGTPPGSYDMIVKVRLLKDGKVYDISQKTVSVQVTAP